jgi:hypothetical protein
MIMPLASITSPLQASVPTETVFTIPFSTMMSRLLYVPLKTFINDVDGSKIRKCWMGTSTGKRKILITKSAELTIHGCSSV